MSIDVLVGSEPETQQPEPRLSLSTYESTGDGESLLGTGIAPDAEVALGSVCCRVSFHEYKPNEDKPPLKSGYSSAACTCVEVLLKGNKVYITDSKWRRDPKNLSAKQPYICLSASEYKRFWKAVYKGKSYLSDQLQMTVHKDGLMELYSPSTAVVLSYTPEETIAFFKGVRAGELSIKHLKDVFSDNEINRHSVSGLSTAIIPYSLRNNLTKILRLRVSRIRKSHLVDQL